MKNKNFFYLQYNKIDWKNQEKTRINFRIYDYIIKNIIRKKKGGEISIFDIGIGIGLFPKKLYRDLKNRYQNIVIEGCEPSKRNYEYFSRKKPVVAGDAVLQIQNKTFLNVHTKTKFDFVTAIYVFPHFVFGELEKVVKKIRSLLTIKGKFILVVANEEYLERKLKTEKDLFIERSNIFLGGKKYKEVLHYSDIPKIGKVIDYNRETSFYINLFKNNKFSLKQKRDMNDGGFICTLFVFEKRGR